MINLQTTETLNTFINEGELVQAELITEKFNAVSIIKIDLRKTNVDEKIYINLGQEVDPEEINVVYNT